MSSLIVYTTQFIRSDSGITPVWLTADSRDWDQALKRHPRSWSIFHNLLAVKEQELMETVKECVGSSQHWVCHGRDVDDAAYLRWAKRNIAAAASLEPILTFNSKYDVRCYVSTWDKDSRRTVSAERYCKTTEGFDDWAKEAKAVIASTKEAGGWAFPIVDFMTDDLKNPPVQDGLPKRVCPRNAAIRFCSGEKTGMYVMDRTRGKLRLAYNIENAKHYPGQKAAERAMVKMMHGFSRYGDLEVVIDTTQ